MNCRFIIVIVIASAWLVKEEQEGRNSTCSDKLAICDQSEARLGAVHPQVCSRGVGAGAREQTIALGGLHLAEKGQRGIERGGQPGFRIMLKG